MSWKTTLQLLKFGLLKWPDHQAETAIQTSYVLIVKSKISNKIFKTFFLSPLFLFFLRVRGSFPLNEI